MHLSAASIVGRPQDPKTLHLPESCVGVLAESEHKRDRTHREHRMDLPLRHLCGQPVQGIKVKLQKTPKVRVDR